LVATTRRTSNNIYVLNEIGREKCFLRKENEIYLWHRWMGDMKFEKIVLDVLADLVSTLVLQQNPRNHRSLW
jgi:hypothetical protein